MTTVTGKYIPLVLSLKVLWPSQNTQSLHPPQVHCVQSGFHYIWGGKGAGKHICLLAGQSPHHLKDIQHCVQHIQKVKLEPGEVMTSYDVKALLNSVPVDPSITIVKHNLPQDPTLPPKDQHVHTTNHHTTGVLPQKHILAFQGKFYEQVHGATMGSPINPLIANLFMDEFKVKALSSAQHPQLRLRYIDDTFVIQEAEHSQQLLQHINTQDPHIQFTEGSRPRGISTIPRSLGFSRSQQHPHYISLQKAPTHRSISTLGQQPLHCS